MKVQTGTAQTESVTDSTTIEVMLSAQQMSALAGGPRLDATQHHKPRIVIGALSAAVLIVAGSVAHLAAKQNPVPTRVAQAAAPLPPPPPVEAPVPVGEPVLFKNPFDRTEVFEFPPGTTRDEARDAVAKALMERAQGRGPGVLKLRSRKIHHSQSGPQSGP
jgi:hypothetical protein